MAHLRPEISRRSRSTAAVGHYAGGLGTKEPTPEKLKRPAIIIRLFL